MKILEVGVTNFRSISHDQGVNIELGTLTALAGANDSGKTAFLLGSYIGLMGLVGVPKGRDILYHRYIGELNKHHSADIPIENIQPTIVRIKVVLQAPDIDKHLSRAESWMIRGRQIPFAQVLQMVSDLECVFDVNVDALFNESGQVNKDSIGPDKWLNHEETMRAVREKVTVFSGSPEEREAFASDFLSVFRQNMKWDIVQGQVLYIPAERHFDLTSWNPTQSFDYKQLKEFQIGIEVRELFQCIASLEAEGNERKYRKFIELLRMLYPIEEVRTKLTPFGQDVFVRQKGRMQPISRSGTGLAQIMYICARILETPTDLKAGLNIAIIDEPETGLHPGLQRSFTELMKILSDLYGVQWLFGSHSPFMFRAVDSSRGDKLWSITHDGQKSHVRCVNHSEAVQELYASIGLHLPLILTAKAVVFCEGISEVNFLPRALHKVGFDASNVVFVTLGGIGNLKHIAPDELHSLHPDSMLVLDWDDGDTKDSSVRKKLIESRLKVHCDSGYRTLENSYSPEVVARVCECDKTPQIEPFDSPEVIKRKLHDAGCKREFRKAVLAQKIAEAMTEEECRTHPLVASVLRWLQSL